MSEKEKKAKKRKLTVRTPSMIERSIRTKWIIYGSIFVGVIWLGAMSAITDGKKGRQRAPAPEFADVLPDVRQSDERAFARMQVELREIRESLKEQNRAQERELESLRTALERERQAREELIEKTKRELAQEPKAVREKRESNIVAPAPKPRGSDPGTAFADYIRPPRIGDEGGIVPPPPLVRDAQTDGQLNRPNLPRRDSDQGNLIAGETASKRTDPIIMDSKSSKRDPRVLHGPEQDVKSADEQASMSGVLPVGSFASVALLTGADFGASQATQSNPQPVLMRVQADAILPGRAKYQFKGCFAMGSGYGELSSERAYIQLARISCVDRKTGQMLESPIQGYVVDSDGKLGLRGTVSRRSGIILGKAMLAGFAEGAAEILSAAGTNATDVITGSGVVRTITPGNVGEIGLYGGAGRAAEILADQYIKEAENMFPVIEIEAGRRGTIVVQVGQKLEWSPYNPSREVAQK